MSYIFPFRKRVSTSWLVFLCFLLHVLHTNFADILKERNEKYMCINEFSLLFANLTEEQKKEYSEFVKSYEILCKETLVKIIEDYMAHEAQNNYKGRTKPEKLTDEDKILIFKGLELKTKKDILFSEMLLRKEGFAEFTLPINIVLNLQKEIKLPTNAMTIAKV